MLTSLEDPEGNVKIRGDEKTVEQVCCEEFWIPPEAKKTKKSFFRSRSV